MDKTNKKKHQKSSKDISENVDISVSYEKTASLIELDDDELKFSKILQKLYDTSNNYKDSLKEDEEHDVNSFFEFGNVKDILHDLFCYYEEYHKHFYYEISQFLIDNSNLTEIVSEDPLAELASSVKMLIQFCERQTCEEVDLGDNRIPNSPSFCKTCLYFDKECCYTRIENNLMKLYDHIRLEIVRIGAIREANIQFKDELDKAQKDVKQTQDDLNKAQKKLTKATVKASSTQQDYITILGIFAAVVIGATGSMTFTSSILQNLSNMQLGQAGFAFSFAALLFLNIIIILTEFIHKIQTKTDISNVETNESTKKPNTSIWTKWPIILNVILLAAVIGFAIMWYWSLPTQ